jgi:hypothetical protein
MKTITLFVVLLLSACASYTPPAPIAKPGYATRDFTKANPNEGFPTVNCDSCGGEGNGSSDGK